MLKPETVEVIERLLNHKCPYCGGPVQWYLNQNPAYWASADSGRCLNDSLTGCRRSYPLNPVRPDVLFRQILEESNGQGD